MHFCYTAIQLLRKTLAHTVILALTCKSSLKKLQMIHKFPFLLCKGLWIKTSRRGGRGETTWCQTRKNNPWIKEERKKKEMETKDQEHTYNKGKGVKGTMKGGGGGEAVLRCWNYFPRVNLDSGLPNRLSPLNSLHPNKTEVPPFLSAVRNKCRGWFQGLTFLQSGWGQCDVMLIWLFKTHKPPSGQSLHVA